MRYSLILISFTIILLLGNAAESVESTADQATSGKNYGLGWIEDGYAYINLVEFSYWEDFPDIVQDVAEELVDSPYRETYEVEELSDVLPEWATESVLLISQGSLIRTDAGDPGGWVLSDVVSAFIATDDCGAIFNAGIVIQVPETWSVQIYNPNIPDYLNRYSNWVVATGTRDLPETVLVDPSVEFNLIESNIHSVINARLEGYTDEFLGDNGSTSEYQTIRCLVKPGLFEGCGDDGAGGEGYAVFYCLSTGMEFAGAVEIIDRDGNVKVEVSPWEGVGEFHGWYFEPIGVIDVDNDGWDELIIHTRLWELDAFELWDPTPSGTEVLASWATGGC